MGKRNRQRRQLAPVAMAAPPPRATPAVVRPIDALVDAVASGALDDDLERLAAVVGERRRLVNAQYGLRVKASLAVGDRVRIIGDPRPMYLKGRYGTVTGLSGKYVEVRLDDAVGRNGLHNLRCPAEALEPVRAE